MMRSYSFFTILMLCGLLLLVDIFAFYWLQSITQQINLPYLETIINSSFWIFTFGLILSILVLKRRVDQMNTYRKQMLISSFYGIVIASFVPKLIFSIVISILYFTNYLFSEKESLLIVPIVGLLSGFLPFFVILNGIFRTLYRFKVYKIKVHVDEISKNIAGLRIAHISDLHLGSFNFRYHILDRTVNIINNLEPDLIVFTGDLVNNHAWELKGWSKVLSKLKAKLGKFSVLGNHDYGDYSKWKTKKAKQSNFELIKHFHKKIGFKLLLNESSIVNYKNDKIAIVGVENWGNPPFKQYGNLKKSLEGLSDLPFKILLSHDPSHWVEEVVSNTNIALTLSGHTHGMQAGLNIRKREWSPIKYKYKQWAGLYKINSQYLYVNRGLGWLGFPGRLGMRPEITLLEIF